MVVKLITEQDLSWIADMLDIVVACQGQPWRTALDRLDGFAPVAHASPDELRVLEHRVDDDDVPSTRRISQKRVHAVLRAIQRVLGRSTQADLAKTCRALVLGKPALEPTDRLDRITAAARSLELSVASVEQLLWVDLPRERPVALPYGRPSELEIAAFANVQLIERTLRRAQTAQLRIRGDAGLFLRGAARCGLLTSARPASDADGETIIDIVGPLALFHRTSVYGRALAALVPLLAEVTAFELAVTSKGFTGDYTVQLGSPALLPRTSASLLGPSKIVARLARDLERALTLGRKLPGGRITIAPPAILANGAYLCPDLLMDDTCIELVGFWTGEHLARKRAAYEAAGLRVVLCADELRGCSGEEVPHGVIAYTKHVDAAAVVDRVAARYDRVADDEVD
jgi:predicted nuclease of restriction endonuclease-like RecB superfamily